jgi:hypothetical protein
MNRVHMQRRSSRDVPQTQRAIEGSTECEATIRAERPAADEFTLTAEHPYRLSGQGVPCAESSILRTTDDGYPVCGEIAANHASRMT